MSRRIVILSAGLSQPSTTRLLADRIGQAVQAQITGRGESAEVEVVELKDLAIDLATAMTTGGMPTPRLARVRETVSAADGIVAVSPVFTASYSGLFKMFFDVLDPEALNGMPVIIAATAGTPRHSLVLDHAIRPLFTYLRAVVVPTGVFAATEDFGDGEAGRTLTSRIHRAAAEFATLVLAEKTGVEGFAPIADVKKRVSGIQIDRAVTPFMDMLQEHVKHRDPGRGQQ
ncbi:MsuE subfamily FMN reductase [Pseudaminobacter salicylatoxidans]|uniref:MsuE subfamily FMN reductase n=1 Tax=Pseudaminobacter salicylatoxidans TaxID=93369 RepID=A0A316C9Z6_PSESE|nr:FMN reductase [Pseudaminobacter salicylatoxidans]PWJ86635.1 MsuE subfamily FMN reductase [Pseudaminobacter salicylatoxidans]